LLLATSIGPYYSSITDITRFKISRIRLIFPSLVPRAERDVEPRSAGIISNEVAGKLQRQLQAWSFLEARELELAGLRRR